MRGKEPQGGGPENIIEASWQAFLDSINDKLLKDEKTGS
jgi:hypothetical protein